RFYLGTLDVAGLQPSVCEPTPGNDSPIPVNENSWIDASPAYSLQVLDRPVGVSEFDFAQPQSCHRHRSMESWNLSSARLDVLETVLLSTFEIEGMEFQQSEGVTENRRPGQIAIFLTQIKPFAQQVVSLSQSP